MAGKKTRKGQKGPSNNNASVPTPKTVKGKMSPMAPAAAEDVMVEHRPAMRHHMKDKPVAD